MKGKSIAQSFRTGEGKGEPIISKEAVYGLTWEEKAMNGLKFTE
jgi:hypothetical protein